MCCLTTPRPYAFFFSVHYNRDASAAESALSSSRHSREGRRCRPHRETETSQRALLGFLSRNLLQTCVLDSLDMDGHYSSNVIGTSASSYPSPAAISPHQLQNGQLQQNGHLPPHTLPPLQPQNPAMQSIYGSHPHTPRTTPGTPGTPQPQNMSSYPQPPSQGSGRGGYPGMMSNQYPQPHQGYGTSSSMMSQSSVAASHPQPIAPAPASRPPVLRPMPAGGVMPTSGMSSPYGQSPLMPHQQSLLQQESEQPTHVVGSQGRRGILPSAPGRPAAPTGTGAAKSTVIPQKDADGKFPCPHCTKTYLHAKHLKRHLLRRKLSGP